MNSSIPALVLRKQCLASFAQVSSMMARTIPVFYISDPCSVKQRSELLDEYLLIYMWLILSCVIYLVWGCRERERGVKEEEACLDLVCLEHRHRYLLEWWIIHSRHGLGPVYCQYHLRSVIGNLFWLNNLARTTCFSLPTDTTLGNSWHWEQKTVNSLRLTLSCVFWGDSQDLSLPVHLILEIIWYSWNQQTHCTYEFKSSSF